MPANSRPLTLAVLTALVPLHDFFDLAAFSMIWHWVAFLDLNVVYHRVDATDAVNVRFAQFNVNEALLTPASAPRVLRNQVLEAILRNVIANKC